MTGDGGGAQVDIVMMLAVSGNDPRFVPHAERFMPERWLKGDDPHAKGHPFATLPFGFGPRICIGKRFAELEIEVLNAKLLRNFKVEYPCKGEFQTRLLHILKSPMTFRLTDRD
ncbi:Uncharacterized protein GBIM_12770 [Gryllus bimaculatus]|nr:Uncharacterized protein GBIM_12770 [Gryllus bimaculatus]